MAALLVLSAVGLRFVRFDPDVMRLLPAGGRSISAFRAYLQRFGALDDLYLVFSAPPERSIGEYADDIEIWAEELRQLPELSRVDTGTTFGERDWAWLADRQLLLLGDAPLAEALTRLQPSGLSPALEKRRELLALPSPEMAALVQQDPLGLSDLLQRELGSMQPASSLRVRAGGYVTDDGTHRLVIARPRQGPFDTTFSHALMSRLQEIETRMRQRRRVGDGEMDEPLPPMEVTVAGGHRIAVEAEAVVRRESIVNGIGSLALILPLLFVVFRSVWLIAIGGVPSAVSLLVVLSSLGAAGVTLSAAAAGASAMLFGLGVDGVVLMYVAHQLALAEGRSPSGAIQALGVPAISMLLGAWTTAATFLGLTVVDFPSLEQLGVIVGLSMAASGVLTLLLVPAALSSRAPTRRARQLTLPAFASWVVRRRGPVGIVALVVTVVLGLASMSLRVNPTFDRLRSITPGAVALQTMARRFGLPTETHLVLATGPDLEGLLSANEEFVERVRRVVPDLALQAPSALLPSAETQRSRSVRVREALPPAGVLRDALARATVEAGFRAEAFDAFASRLPRLVDPREPLTYEELRTHGFDDVLSRLISRDQHGWTLATYAFPQSPEHERALKTAVAFGAPDMVLTGLPVVNEELAARFAPEFFRGLATGTAVVLLLLYVSFRDLRLSLLALTPTIVGLVWAAGLLSIARVEMDLFAVFAVVTFVGIGVDYGIHLVHRYRHAGEAERALAELSPVILVAGTITLLGYGTLAGSSYPPLRSIGLVSVVSVLTLVAASVFVLPALLPWRPPGR